MSKKKVIVFGVFDHLHPGHKFFLKQAKQLGDSLIVIVACDIMIRKVKKLTPTYSEKQRLQMVKDLNIADRVILGQPNLKKKYDMLLELQPNIIALGYDQEIFVDKLPLVVKEMEIPSKIVRLKPFKPKSYKSSIYRKKK